MLLFTPIPFPLSLFPSLSPSPYAYPCGHMRCTCLGLQLEGLPRVADQGKCSARARKDKRKGKGIGRKADRDRGK